MEGQTKVFARMTEEMIRNATWNDGVYRLASNLLLEWQKLARPDHLPFSLRTIAELCGKDVASIQRLMKVLIDGGYVVVNKGNVLGAKNTYSLSLKLTGMDRPTKNAGLCVTSSSVCDLTVLEAELKHRYIHDFLPTFKKLLERSPISTNSAVSIVQSFSRKIARVKAGKDAFYGPIKDYLAGAFRTKYFEENPPKTTLLTSPAAGPTVDADHKVDQSILRLREIVRILDNDGVIVIGELPERYHESWLRDGIVSYYDQGNFKTNPSYKFFLKETTGEIHAIPESVYLQRREQSKRGNTLSLSQSIDRLNIEVSHPSHTVAETPSTV